MAKRRKNVLDPSVELVGNVERQAVSLAESKSMFLRDIRGLAKQTQRWHRENITALENVLARQDIVIEDVMMLTTSFIKDRFVFYMLEDMGLKPNTINGRIRSVKAFSKFLHKEGVVEQDFALDLPLIKSEKVIIQTFSEEQLQRLLRQPDRHTFTGFRDYTLLLLLIETGIRISECVSITLDDVRMKDGHILIHGKGSKQRLVPFQSKFKKVLQEYLKFRGQMDCQALFVTVNGTPISKRYVQELIQKYGEQAHIENVRVSPHTFRHTMAKYYILAGGDVFSLQRILGHSSVETVRIYVEMFADDVHAQHKRFSYLENKL